MAPATPAPCVSQELAALTIASSRLSGDISLVNLQHLPGWKGVFIVHLIHVLSLTANLILPHQSQSTEKINHKGQRKDTKQLHSTMDKGFKDKIANLNFFRDCNLASNGSSLIISQIFVSFVSFRVPLWFVFLFPTQSMINNKEPVFEVKTGSGEFCVSAE